jgi:hypothetical protein
MVLTLGLVLCIMDYDIGLLDILMLLSNKGELELGVEWMTWSRHSPLSL